MDSICQEVSRLLKAAHRILFITGAGISAGSGLPTYRGVGGLYNDEMTSDGMPIEDALSGQCLASHPEITWKYLEQIEQNCRSVSPNAGHRAIARLERWLDVVILTQNIDGLHALAGSTNIIEIHGNLGKRFCQNCGTPADADDKSMPPRCGSCGKVVRPAVVLFGERLPEAAISQLGEEMSHGFDMVFIVGTSALFPYITEPALQAMREGTPVVEINPARTHLSDLVPYYIPMPAEEALPQICPNENK